MTKTRKGDNAFAIIGAYIRAAKRAGFDKATIDAKVKDATSGDYDHLCKVLLGR